MVPQSPELMEYENVHYLFYFMKWKDWFIKCLNIHYGVKSIICAYKIFFKYIDFLKFFKYPIFSS